jgi:hypothetical protein
MNIVIITADQTWIADKGCSVETNLFTYGKIKINILNIQNERLSANSRLVIFDPATIIPKHNCSFGLVKMTDT